MKRPGVVWVFTITIILGILWELFGTYLFFVGGLGNTGIISIISVVISLILIIPRAVMIAKFFLLQKNALLWVHISFGAALAFGILEYIVFFATLGPLGTALVTPPSLLLIGFYIFFWWAVADYIKKKKVGGQPVFI